MPTLYVTESGFRFPYSKWSDTSTPKNLQFLEAQLEEYLHMHETDGTTLYVTSTGFRMPKTKDRDNLEENMKFVEQQLTEYLHEHELSGGSGFDLTFVRTIDNAAEPSGPTYGGGFFWSADSNGAIYRINLSTGAATQVTTIPDSADSDDGMTYHDGRIWTLGRGLVYIYNVSADTWAGPFDIEPVFSGNLMAGLMHTGTHIWSHDWNHQEVGVFDPDDLTEIETFTLVGTNFENGIANGIMNLDGNAWFAAQTDEIHIMDIATRTFTDTITDPLSVDHNNDAYGLGSDGEVVWFSSFNDSLIYEYRLPTTRLVTTHQGFRFPYDWEKEGEIEINMKFMQDQMSKFLHKHEVSS